MKKALLTLLCGLMMVSTLSAQRPKTNSRQHQKSYGVELTVSAASTERFIVYIDGLPQSMKSGSRFIISDIAPNQTHDVAVVL